MEPSCLSVGQGQPPLQGIPHCCMHYSVGLHCVQSHITVTHSKGFPAEVINLANTAGVMPAVADIPDVWRHNPGEVGLKVDMLRF